MAERTYLVARWIRIWHWTNAALIVLLGLTGMSIHFADPALPLVDFALAVRLHNIAGVLLIRGNGLDKQLYVLAGGIAAYGIALEARRLKAASPQQFHAALDQSVDLVAAVVNRE